MAFFSSLENTRIFYLRTKSKSKIPEHKRQSRKADHKSPSYSRRASIKILLETNALSLQFYTPEEQGKIAENKNIITNNKI
jgi:hypothetical protein